MPFYLYECKAGHQTEGLCTIKERDKPVPCSTCGKKTKRIATPVEGIVRNPAVPRSRS